MNIEYHNMKPQDEVPAEVIIHYVIKDYRRMFLTYDEMRTRAEKAEAKIIELQEKHQSQILKRDKEIKELQKNAASQDTSNDRIKELEEKLASAQQQNKLLAQAIIAQNSSTPITSLQGLLPVDAQELEKKVGSQLGDALIKLTATEERLNNYMGVLQDAIAQGRDYQEIKSFLTKAARAFSKIDSAVQHIENFYRLVNGVPLT